METVSLTLVICTHNRCQLLARTLESIQATVSPPGADINLLVIANACTDDTESWLAGASAASTRYALAWKPEPAPGKSHALNRAIGLVKSDYVALVDDDHRMPDDFFLRILEAIREHPSASMICGCVRPDWDGREPAWIHDQARYPITPKPVPHFEPFAEGRDIGPENSIPGGGNLFIERRVFDVTGGFSTALGPCGDSLGGSEDTDFVLRALKAGERLYYEPKIVQYHYVDLDRLRLGYLVRKSYERSRSISSVRGNIRNRPPRYLWRKLVSYGLRAILSLNTRRTRYYLVRTAAAWGEIRSFQ